jgi:hypothetical protein
VTPRHKGFLKVSDIGHGQNELTILKYGSGSCPSVLVTTLALLRGILVWNAGWAASNQFFGIAQRLLSCGGCRVVQNTRQSDVTRCQVHLLAWRVIRSQSNDQIRRLYVDLQGTTVSVPGYGYTCIHYRCGVSTKLSRETTDRISIITLLSHRPTLLRSHRVPRRCLCVESRSLKVQQSQFVNPPSPRE